MQTAANALLFATAMAFLWVAWSLNWTAGTDAAGIYPSRLAAFHRLRRVYYAAILLAFAALLGIGAHLGARNVAALGPDVTRAVLVIAAPLATVAVVFGIQVVHDARVRRRG